MKKIVYLCIFLASFQLFSQEKNIFINLTGGWQIKNNLGLEGKEYLHGADISKDDKTEFNFSGSFAAGKIFTDYFQQGIGITFQGNPELKNGEDTDISFLPVYTLFRLGESQKLNSPYVVTHVGYNFLTSKDSDNDKGGLYFAAGIGIFADYAIAEFLYKNFSGSSENGIMKSNYSYETFEINVGINFKFFN